MSDKHNWLPVQSPKPYRSRGWRFDWSRWCDYVVLHSPPEVIRLKPMVNEQLVYFPFGNNKSVLSKEVLLLWDWGKLQLGYDQQISLKSRVIRQWLCQNRRSDSSHLREAEIKPQLDAKLDVLKRILSRLLWIANPCMNCFAVMGWPFDGQGGLWSSWNGLVRPLLFAESLTTGALWRLVGAGCDPSSRVLSLVGRKKQDVVYSSSRVRATWVSLLYWTQAMASRARKLTGSDYGVSLTGAGPDDSRELSRDCLYRTCDFKWSG